MVHDDMMEEAVIGMLIRFPHRIHDCGVTADHFFQESNRRVIREFLAKGPGLAVAASALHGDVAQAMELSEAAFSDASLEQHLEHLQNLSRHRSLASSAAGLIERIGSIDPSEASDAAVEAAAELLALAAGSSGTMSMGEDADDCLNEPGGELMQTFLEGLPVRRKELIGIAARPGCGKTTMAHSLGEWFTKGRDGAFVVFTMEVTRKEWFQRTIRQHVGCEVPQYLGSGELCQRYQEVANAVKASYAARPGRLAVEDKAGLTIAQIRAKALALKAKHGSLSGIAIDQLSNVKKLRERGMSESTAIKNTTEASKQLGRELDCPTFLLSQFNRDPSGEGGWYTERDIFGSDGLLQDADQIWLLQNRPGSDLNQAIRSVNLRRVKWRNGVTGEMDLEFNTPASTFRKSF